jgi:type I restriction enzyme R subunit
VKTAARELLDTLKAERLVLDWRKRQQTQAQVQLTVEEKLDAHLPEAYDVDLFEQKVNQVYDHIYKNYYGAGRSVYAAVG